MTANNFINNIDNKTFNKIRSSLSDSEARRYLRELLNKLNE